MHDLLIPIVFYLFSALAIVSATLVITQNNPVRCVLFLVLTFFSCAVLWLLVEAEFLALVLILVYVGAVMTLFLFVVMMLNIDTESLRSHFIRYLPFGLVLVALLVGLLLVALPENWSTESVEARIATEYSLSTVDSALVTTKPLSNTEQIGLLLYVDYVYAFELAAIILLVAIIAAISLAHRVTRTKRQNILAQLMTQAKDRITLVSMKSEK